LKQWYLLLFRISSFLNLGLRERVAIALLQLCSDFDVEESRGGACLYDIFIDQRFQALVGRRQASRPLHARRHYLTLQTAANLQQPGSHEITANLRRSPCQTKRTGRLARRMTAALQRSA
jgi:hypothetical protein